MTSIAQSVLLMCHDQLFCFVLFFCRVHVCVAMVWTIWSVLGVYFISLVQWLISFMCFLRLPREM